MISKPFKKHRCFVCRCGSVVETISRTQKYCAPCAKHNKALTAKLYTQHKSHEHRA